MWQANTGACLQAFQHNESQVNDLAFSNDGLWLAAAGYEKIRLFDPYGANTPVTTISEMAKNVNTVGFNDMQTWLYAAGEDRTAKVIDWRSNAAVTRCLTAASSINSCILHHNQNELFIGTDHGEINIWDLRNEKKPVFSILPSPNGGPIHSISMDLSGTSIAAVNSCGELMVWSLGSSSSTYKPVSRHRSQVHASYALKVQYSPDGTTLVTCGADSKFNVIQTADFSISYSKTDKGASYWIWDCAFSADSRYLLTASSDALARLWNLETGEERFSYRGHKKAVTCMAFRDQSLDEC